MNKIINDISNFIFLKDEPQKADAIIVVGGSLPELAETAADLWKKEYAPKILIGGGVSIKTGKFPGPRSKQDKYNKNYETEYDFYKDILLQNGVKDSVIFGENKSGFTRENALFAKQAADENKLEIKKALLVCQSFHSRRCLMFFQSAFADTEFFIIPFKGINITKENWFKTELGVKRVLGELSRCGSQLNYSDITRFLQQKEE